MTPTRPAGAAPVPSVMCRQPGRSGAGTGAGRGRLGVAGLLAVRAALAVRRARALAVSRTLAVGGGLAAVRPGALAGSGRAVRLAGLGASVLDCRGDLAAVRSVKTGALEHDADRREDLAQASAAGREFGQRVIGEPLYLLDLLRTRGARVLVRRHGHSFRL